PARPISDGEKPQRCRRRRAARCRSERRPPPASSPPRRTRQSEGPDSLQATPPPAPRHGDRRRLRRRPSSPSAISRPIPMGAAAPLRSILFFQNRKKGSFKIGLAQSCHGIPFDCEREWI